MNEKLKNLREDRSKEIASARAILDAADNEKRSMTEEEEKRYNKHFDEAARLKNSIEREERQIEAEREVADRALAAGDAERAAEKGKPVSPEERQLLGFRSYLQRGASFDGQGAAEFRALQNDYDSKGGYLVPQQFATQLIQALDDAVFIRNLATVIPVMNSDSLGVPSLDADPADADWTSELETGSEDSTMSFGKRELKPYPVAKRIKVSRKLLRNAAMPVEQLVLERLAYKFGITEEKAFLTGSGAGQPLGLFTASNDGIGTGRDVSTDNTTTAFTMDGLQNAKYSLKAPYRKNAKWLFHRTGVKMASKLKDGEGQYLWQPSKKEGEPDMLLGAAVLESEYAPSTFTTGLYVGMFGDFSYYWIADCLAQEIQRLEELYAETNQVGFIGRLEADGMPVLDEAFARVTLA